MRAILRQTPAGGTASLRDGIDDIDHARKMRRRSAVAAGLQNTVKSGLSHRRHRLVGEAAGLLGLQRARADRVEQILRP